MSAVEFIQESGSVERQESEVTLESEEGIYLDSYQFLHLFLVLHLENDFEI